MSTTSANQLDRRSESLCQAFDPERFAQEAASVTDLLREYLHAAGAGECPVWPAVSPDDLLEAWPDPESGPRSDVASLVSEILAASTSQHHPGFVGQQLSTPPSLAGPVAMVSAMLNNSSAIFEGAPVAIAMEHRIVTWMAGKAGYGTAAGGVLTSGGTLGALTAMLAMRQSRMPGDPWAEGVPASVPCAVFVSEQSHYCNRRACAVLGLGEQSVVAVATDSEFRMDLNSLRDAWQQVIDTGIRPLAVVANAGSTSTGSHDDLQAVGDFCEEHGLWFHVDAAHGGGALLSDRYSSAMLGIERADSIVWDAHKMMLMPGLCTAVLFRDARHLDEAFRQEAAYLLSDVEASWHQPAARNFETTKPTMAFTLYVALRTLGSGFLAECVDYSYDLARAFADEIEKRPEFDLLIRPECNIVCFRYESDNAASDALQLQLRDAVNRKGNFFIMRTMLRGKVWLRVVLMNPATRLEHLYELLDQLCEASACANRKP